MTRRPLKPWEIVAVLLRQLRVNVSGTRQGQEYVRTVRCDFVGGGDFVQPVLACPRTGEPIVAENVRRIQIEHYPIAHKDGGETSVDNCIISLAEGHAIHTKRERKQSAKERRLRVARLAKAEVEKKLSKPKWRLKKKMDGTVVKVRTR